ncbi:hypothetical protein ASPFODRAFT_53988 [Aspergillus luchuensis CBS 106.47]|uniref:Uncharacterized protein n=1 Tax=Aspergillus luchuensis (strain CBS 106.47) TaxID=1137211 RepID=A0A1M3T028_ASPLC|nr:hypothetical protein ASPFODRAFT_53988 [Aspergillus luchuensis CBS 106.47]
MFGGFQPQSRRISQRPEFAQSFKILTSKYRPVELSDGVSRLAFGCYLRGHTHGLHAVDESLPHTFIAKGCC